MKQLPGNPMTVLEPAGPPQVPSTPAALPEPMATPIIEPDHPATVHLRVLYRHRWLALGVFLTVFGLNTLDVLRATPIFEGRTTLLIDVGDPKVVNFSQILTQDPVSNDFYQTQFELLQSRTLARQTVETLGLAPRGPAQGVAAAPSAGGQGGSRLERITSSVKRMLGIPGLPPTLAPVDPVDQVTAMLRRGLVVEPKKNSRIVEIRYYSPIPEHAAAVPNALARNYINLTMNFRFQTAKDGSKWLEQQITEQRRAVEASEEALQRYREKYNALALGEKQAGIVSQKLGDLNQSLSRARSTRIEKQALHEQLRSVENNLDALDTYPLILGNPTIQRIKVELTEQQRQLAQLSQKLGDRHPDMVTLKAAIQTTQARLKDETSRVVQSVRTEYLAAQAHETRLVADLREQENQAMALDRKGIEFGVLQRDAESTRLVFQNLLQRAKELDVSSELKTTNIRVVDEAVVPRAPVLPQRLRSAGIGFVAALVLAIGLVFGVEYFDHRIKSPDEVLVRLGLPLLALVPKFSRRLRDKVPIFGNASEPGMREAFSDLRASVLLSVSEEPMKILVTSAGPSEGKTLAATNLAVALAQTDRRVLLVDVDFRLPSVHDAFGQPLKPGLSDVLRGAASGADALRPTSIAGLTILPAGNAPGDPAALLALPSFAEFLRNSTRHFDCVVFDTPPLMAVADATALGREVNGVVFVVRANKTARRTAQLALARIEETGARVLGVVLNGADVKRHGYYYHPYYRREYASYYSRPARS